MQYPLSTEVEFKGDKLTTIVNDGIEYVAMKPIVESIGLDWKSQHSKLSSQKKKFNYGHITIVAEDGKLREMLRMPHAPGPDYLLVIAERFSAPP